MAGATILAFLLQGAALGVTAAASPGPLQAYQIHQTLAAGFRRAAPLTLAPLVSDTPIVVGMLLLLGSLPPLFFRLLSLAGGVYVLFLAWSLWKQRRQGPAAASAEASASGLGRAVVMNFLNPNPYMFWALVNGPILLSALKVSAGHGAAFLLGFYGCFLGGMLALLALFGGARRLGPRVVSALSLLSLGILVAFGGILLRRAILGA